jgi:DNA helicase-2/ATP-dependent DNA helicase PcrA
MAEERRLFYVGITRAKDKLYLVRSAMRGGRGYNEATYPSRFLDDIPAELMLGKSRAGGRASRPQARWMSSTPRVSSTLSKRARPEPAPATRSPYRMGTRIRHPEFGEGIILNNKTQNGEETVTVVFESVGIKRLAVGIVKLDII